MGKKGPAIWRAFTSGGEARQKAKEETWEVLRDSKSTQVWKTRSFSRRQDWYTDIAFGWLTRWFDVLEEVSGVKLFDADAFPRLHAWINDFKEVPVVKDNLPDYEKLEARFSRFVVV